MAARHCSAATTSSFQAVYANIKSTNESPDLHEVDAIEGLVFCIDHRKGVI